MGNMPRLKEKYIKEVIPQMMKQFGYKNIMQVPKIEKVVLNMGVGEATQNLKILDEAREELAQISGQRPKVTRAKKSIAAFKLRENMPIGCYVTLRGKRMYYFLDKLFSVVIPRLRDFRGLSPSSFDKGGNYTFGIKEQLIFPEISYDKVTTVKGMDITIVTTAKKIEESKALLKLMGMPIK